MLTVTRHPDRVGVTRVSRVDCRCRVAVQRSAVSNSVSQRGLLIYKRSQPAAVKYEWRHSVILLIKFHVFNLIFSLVTNLRVPTLEVNKMRPNGKNANVSGSVLSRGERYKLSKLRYTSRKVVTEILPPQFGNTSGNCGILLMTTEICASIRKVDILCTMPGAWAKTVQCGKRQSGSRQSN